MPQFGGASRYPVAAVTTVGDPEQVAAAIQVANRHRAAAVATVHDPESVDAAIRGLELSQLGGCSGRLRPRVGGHDAARGTPAASDVGVANCRHPVAVTTAYDHESVDAAIRGHKMLLRTAVATVRDPG